jgi:hypothetical protein
VDISRSTLGELAGLAIERELIKHCTFSKSSVGIAIEDLNVTLSPDDARKLLQLVVTGTHTGQPVSEEGIPGSQAGQPEPATTSVDSDTREAVLQEVARSAVSESREHEQQGPAQETPPSDAYLKRELFRAPQVSTPPDLPHSVAPAREESQPAGGDGDTYREDAVSEEYLDSVLSFALTMGIIEGYTKDRDSRTVTLRTGATTTGLSYWETLEYLTNSMLYELRPRSEG